MSEKSRGDIRIEQFMAKIHAVTATSTALNCASNSLRTACSFCILASVRFLGGAFPPSDPTPQQPGRLHPGWLSTAVSARQSSSNPGLWSDPADNTPGHQRSRNPSFSTASVNRTPCSMIFAPSLPPSPDRFAPAGLLSCNRQSQRGHGKAGREKLKKFCTHTIP